MNQMERSVTHATFSVVRTYPVPPNQVFAAFRDPAIRNQWLDDPDFTEADEFSDDAVFEFRVGGDERFTSLGPDGRVFRYEAVYYDIVPDQRIIYCYEMYENDARISISVATIDLVPEQGGTRLTFTEQGAYLDKFDKPDSREQGVAGQLDSLMRWFEAHD